MLGSTPPFHSLRKSHHFQKAAAHQLGLKSILVETLPRTVASELPGDSHLAMLQTETEVVWQLAPDRVTFYISVG